MRFSIRDDDTNYFTRSEELVSCYQQVWDICPPSLSIIPFVKGEWRYWQDTFYHKGSINEWDKWTADCQIHPIGENASLVYFLKELIKAGKIAAMIHGIHHRNEDKNRRAVPNNLIHYAEFYTNLDYSDKLSSAVRYLEDVFATRITTFTPPQNIISRRGYNAIRSNGLNLVGGGLSFLKREKDINWLKELSNVLSFKLRHRSAYYPHRLDLGSMREYMVHYPLQEVTPLSQLKESFDRMYELDADFVLSTHYHGFPIKHKVHVGRLMSDIFVDFFDYVCGKPGIQFCSVNSLFE